MRAPADRNGSSLASVVERNIAALVARRRAEERRQRLSDRISDRITAFVGSMTFVLIHALGFGLWVVVNLGWTPLPRFDADFVKLATFASVEAIFLSTFVLVTQNRMAALADKRAELDLQISLLGEHEVTRLVRLVRSIADRMGIEEAQAPDLEELEQDVKPEQVLDHMEEASEKLGEDAGPPAP
ncbi:MAG TPA: DUF1003 domain-containing protein [Anaeromyxobacteraceae bacterium]|nr:DUF1003 domain-containing protein [Anaeromyxobacteraceae bacterium]